MPRRCTVCDHSKSRSIDDALVSGAPYRSIAKRFGLSESAVYRHKTDHLPVHLLKAREVEEVVQADNLLEQVKHLQTHALDILERAEKTGDLRTALAAISQARGTHLPRRPRARPPDEERSGRRGRSQRGRVA